MIEMGPLMSENQVKKSLSCVASPHLPRLGVGALQPKSSTTEKKTYLVTGPDCTWSVTSPSAVVFALLKPERFRSTEFNINEESFI